MIQFGPRNIVCTDVLAKAIQYNIAKIDEMDIVLKNMLFIPSFQPLIYSNTVDEISQTIG